jgi:anti-sigma B factor antagonist
VEEGSVFAAAVERPGASTVVVKASGELDLMTVPQLEAALAEAQGEQADIVLDFTQLDFIDSTGVHLVLRVWQASQRNGWDLSITGAGPDVIRAFELVGLLDRLPFRDRGQSAS